MLRAFLSAFDAIYVGLRNIHAFSCFPSHKVEAADSGADPGTGPVSIISSLIGIARCPVGKATTRNIRGLS